MWFSEFCTELIWLNCDSLIPHLLEACVRRDFRNYDSGHPSEASNQTLEGRAVTHTHTHTHTHKSVNACFSVLSKKMMLKKEDIDDCKWLLRWRYSWFCFSFIKLKKQKQKTKAMGFPGFPGGASGKESAYQCKIHKTRGFHLWVGKIPWRRRWQPTPVFLPGESHG